MTDYDRHDIPDMPLCKEHKQWHQCANPNIAMCYSGCSPCVAWFRMCVCLHACMHECARACVPACLSACVRACVCGLLLIECACMPECVCACVHACVRVCGLLLIDCPVTCCDALNQDDSRPSVGSTQLLRLISIVFKPQQLGLGLRREISFYIYH